MGLFDSLFGPKSPPLTTEDPVFGRLTYGKHDGWENRTFAFWGQPAIQLLVDGTEAGPTEQQRAAFVRLRDAQPTLLPRLLEAVEQRQRELHSPPGALTVSGLTVPALDGSKTGGLWTMWFTSTHDDHFQFGVQSTDDWGTFVAFADD